MQVPGTCARPGIQWTDSPQTRSVASLYMLPFKPTAAVQQALGSSTGARYRLSNSLVWAVATVREVRYSNSTSKEEDPHNTNNLTEL